ncbi:helix-turn-helix domain-containing protein [Aidingimonas halophila]|uniref:AraC-type DNA-binding protein n=1 Tax=Aidingimonas halophila TaxID=574349 RepID=A0A1H3AT54_9GAMM|nr:AraC family transcriptional regulator [Aidingimonas halophila]GHC25268.1 hypothetical protein GCM10008094_15340 [Aidingimonas halophila]SDX32581.1 AraC-type DNA-binding protein [Aidingimonas halophila]
MLNDMIRAEIWLQERLESREGIDDLAERLGYSVSQVRRNFKRYFGASPSVYREQLRLAQAAMFLAFSQRNINRIAQQCGYRNHSAFSRTFFKRFRISPRKYRQEQHRTLKAHYRAIMQDYPVAIQRTQGLQAIVTRLYEDKDVFKSLPQWPMADCLDKLPERLRQNAPVALIHGHPMTAQLQRTDLGVTIDPRTAEDMAPPLPFRKLSLPLCRYASVSIDHPDQCKDALTHLLVTNLLDNKESISGLPIHLQWVYKNAKAGCERQNGTMIELRLPLVDHDR